MPTPPPMVASKDDILRAVRAERRKSLALLRTIPTGDWDTPTALPGWRIREVVAHLISTDRASVTGRVIPLLFTTTDRLEDWNETQVPRWATRSVPELLVALDRWGRRFARLAATLPRPTYVVPLPSAWGRVPMAMLIWVRAYDEWIHRQDIRRALDLDDEMVDLDAVVEFLLAVIGPSTIPKLDRAAGRIGLSLSEVTVPEATWDLGRGDGPSVRIEAPAAPFLMAAAGRGAFDDLVESGALTIDGDEGLAKEFLGRLRVV